VTSIGAEAAVDAGGERQRQGTIDSLPEEIEESLDVIGMRVVEF
jgi:hypothetical protein